MDGVLFVNAAGPPGRILLAAAAPCDGRMLWLSPGSLFCLLVHGRAEIAPKNQTKSPLPVHLHVGHGALR